MTPAQALQAAFTAERDRDLARLSYWWNGCGAQRVSCFFWRQRCDDLHARLFGRDG